MIQVLTRENVRAGSNFDDVFSKVDNPIDSNCSGGIHLALDGAIEVQRGVGNFDDHYGVMAGRHSATHVNRATAEHNAVGLGFVTGADDKRGLNSDVKSELVENCIQLDE